MSAQVKESWVVTAGACGFVLGALMMDIANNKRSESLSYSIKNIAGEFYPVATDQNLVTEQELADACAQAVNEKTKATVKAWVNDPPSPANP
jgi:hypothetical protein